MSEQVAYVLRTCAHDMTSYGGFRWPESGPVECPDWEPTRVCRNGLHGLLWGAGNSTFLSWNEEAKWLVVEIQEWIDLGSNVKFPRGIVVHCGDRMSATTDIIARGANSAKCVGAIVVAGDYGIAMVGNRGIATAGDYGIATAGESGTATVGDYGTATAGYGGTATAGESGTATVGDYGTATAGYGGTATAGESGLAIAGEKGIVMAANNGIIQVYWWDWPARHRRILTGYVGEDGIKPNVKYRVVDGKFVEADPAPR